MTDWDSLTWIRATDDPDPAAECIEIAAGEGDLVHLRQSDDPENVITTTQAKWDAFVLGVQNDEFDHFVEGVEGFVPGPNAHKYGPRARSEQSPSEQSPFAQPPSGQPQPE